MLLSDIVSSKKIVNMNKLILFLFQKKKKSEMKSNRRIRWIWRMGRWICIWSHCRRTWTWIRKWTCWD